MATQIPPLMEKQRQAPPAWGPQMTAEDIKDRPEIIADRPHETIIGHIKATIGLLMGWFWFLAIINILGLCFHWIKSHKGGVWDYHTRYSTTVVGIGFWWWVILADVFVIGWYVLKMLVSIAFIILKSVKVLSFAYYLLAPFKNNVNGIIWVVMLTAVFSYILDGGDKHPNWKKGPMDQEVKDRIIQVLWAFLISFIILLVKRGLVLVVEVALYRKLEDDILRFQLFQNSLVPVMKKNPKGALAKILELGPSVDKLLPPGVLGWIKLVTVADELRFEGMHGVDNRLPYGDDNRRIPNILLASEARHVARDFFDTVTPNHVPITKENLQTFCKGSSAGAQLFVMLDRENAGILQQDKVSSSFEYLFVKRAELQRVLDGRQLLVEVTDELLTVIAYFIIFLVFLAAFDLSVSPVMSPNLLVIACLAFVFAPFIRDFIFSLYLIFFIRPFDLGDYITVDAGQNPGEELLVKRTRVMVTHFRNARGEKVYMSNAIIAQSKIHNLSRLKTNRHAALVKLLPSAVGTKK
eukprot:comp21366_c0_seq4/m.46039 comp21366_c0_seq4/g.46039  ORF comp21366_c0_seq4/g.46039 comp21366_c0_seq4/m.46039 type:complete len:523 (-) comp21366_c0_seq4:423-1991(-)